jgi:hypothetical protein
MVVKNRASLPVAVEITVPAGTVSGAPVRFTKRTRRAAFPAASRPRPVALGAAFRIPALNTRAGTMLFRNRLASWIAAAKR